MDQSLTVRSAAASDARPIAALLGRAFDTDPMMAYIFPQPVSRAERLPRLFRAMLCHPSFRQATIDVAVVGAELNGVAIWTPPGNWMPPKRQQLAAMPAFALAFGSRFAAGMRAMSVGAKAHPHEPHWYLALLGVDPDHQGAGIGGTLLRAGLARCDRDRMPVYLDTGKPENLDYYARYGFAVSTELAIPGGPAVWLLRREPVT